jgi:hypothetical protein
MLLSIRRQDRTTDCSWGLITTINDILIEGEKRQYSNSGGHMRFISGLFLFLITAFFFFSCSQTDVSVNTLDPVAVRSNLSQLSLSVLDLPLSSSPSIQKQSEPVLITPDSGGIVTLTNAYRSTNGREVSVSLTLTFCPGSVLTPTTISMKLDQRKAMAHFFPEGTVFAKPVLLDARMTGMDFSSLSKNPNIALYYIGNNIIEKINSGSLSWDAPAGTLSCSGAQIPHFSIYGFGFTK